LTIKPDQTKLAPCRIIAAKLEQCWAVREMVLMAVEVVFLI